MARDAEALVLQMSANLSRFEKSMNSMRAVADKRLTEVERRAMQSDRKLAKVMAGAGDNMVRSFQQSLGALAPTLAAAFSAQQVIRYADSYTSLQNALRATGLEGASLKRIEDALYETANRNGVAVEATAQLYQRAAMARNNLGASEEQLLALVSGTTAALRVQGTSASEAAGPLLQLGQALGGGKIQAEEFNSLIDGLPVLLQAAADGSARFGGEIGKLREAVKKGEVTSKEFFDALLKGFPALEAKAASASQTVGQALQNLNNQLGRYVGQTDSSLSSTQRMAQGINALADNLDTIIPIIGVLIAAIGTRYVWALTASTSAMVANGIASARLIAFQTAMTASMTGTTTATLAATGATRAFTAAIVANPIGAAIVAVAALAAGVYMLSQRYGEAAILQREIASTAGAAAKALDEYEQAAQAAANATGANAKAAADNAARMREEAVAAVASARALRERTAALAAERAQAAQEAAGRLQRSASSGGKGAIEARGGELAAAQSSATRAAELARQASADAAEAEARLSRIDANARTGGYRFTPSVATDDDRNRRRASDQTARAREDLAIEEDIARARASFDTAAIRAAEERQRLVQLTRQYESAGYADANARALEHLALLNQAEERAEGLAYWIKESDAFWESIGENARKAAEAEQLASDQTRDRLRYEAELARLGGSEGMLRDAERRLFIEERSLELLRLRLALTREEAAAMAGAEWAALDSAAAGRDMARSVVGALRSDNIWEEAGRRFRDAAWDGVEDLLTRLFSQMSAGGEGGGWLSALGSLFGGFRAGGGPVSPGRAYVVGEKRPEVFVPRVSGTIIPNVNAAMAGARSIAAMPIAASIKIDLTGANGDEAIRTAAREAAAAGTAFAIRQAAEQGRRGLPASQQRYRRLGTT